jgi:hypothetical protein
MYEITDTMIVAARKALEKNQRSLVGKVTKTSMRLALAAAFAAEEAESIALAKARLHAAIKQAQETGK